MGIQGTGVGEQTCKADTCRITGRRHDQKVDKTKN